MNVNDALVSSGITSGIYILYKTINHYRLRSSCNESNELVLSIVDIEQPKVEEKKQAELKEEVKT